MVFRYKAFFALVCGISVSFSPPAIAKQATVLDSFSARTITPVKCRIKLHGIFLTNGKCIVNTKGANDTLFAQGNGCAVSFKKVRGNILATLWSYRQPCSASSPDAFQDREIEDQPWKAVALVDGCWRNSDISICLG